MRLARDVARCPHLTLPCPGALAYDMHRLKQTLRGRDSDLVSKDTRVSLFGRELAAGDQHHH